MSKTSFFIALSLGINLGIAINAIGNHFQEKSAKREGLTAQGCASMGKFYKQKTFIVEIPDRRCVLIIKESQFTYASDKEMSDAKWGAIVRDLIRLNEIEE